MPPGVAFTLSATKISPATYYPATRNRFFDCSLSELKFSSSFFLLFFNLPSFLFRISYVPFLFAFLFLRSLDRSNFLNIARNT